MRALTSGMKMKVRKDECDAETRRNCAKSLGKLASELKIEPAHICIVIDAP